MGLCWRSPSNRPDQGQPHLRRADSSLRTHRRRGDGSPVGPTPSPRRLQPGRRAKGPPHQQHLWRPALQLRRRQPCLGASGCQPSKAAPARVWLDSSAARLRRATRAQPQQQPQHQQHQPQQQPHQAQVIARHRYRCFMRGETRPRSRQEVRSPNGLLQQQRRQHHLRQRQRLRAETRLRPRQGWHRHIQTTRRLPVDLPS